MVATPNLQLSGQPGYANSTPGTITKGACRGFNRGKGELTFFLEKGFLDIVVDKIPRESFIEAFSPVDKEIRIDI